MTAPAQHDTFTTSDGSSLSFTRRPAPKPGAPRIVLVHSLALDRSVWNGVAERLQGDAEILAYDCRGHGRSDRRSGAYSAELFANDLAQLLDQRLNLADTVVTAQGVLQLQRLPQLEAVNLDGTRALGG